MPQITLTYFPIRARAEATRIMLHDLALEFTEETIAFDAWRSVRDDYPFGQLPVLKVDSIRIPQARVILRWIERSFAPREHGAERQWHIEEAGEALGDLLEAFYQHIWSDDFEATRHKWATRYMPPRLARVDAHLAASGTTYWGGETPSWVDYYAWMVLDSLRPLSASFLEDAPALHALYRALAARPRVAAYLASETRWPSIAAPGAKYCGTPETS